MPSLAQPSLAWADPARPDLALSGPAIQYFSARKALAYKKRRGIEKRSEWIVSICQTIVLTHWTFTKMNLKKNRYLLVFLCFPGTQNKKNIWNTVSPFWKEISPFCTLWVPMNTIVACRANLEGDYSFKFHSCKNTVCQDWLKYSVKISISDLLSH